MERLPLALHCAIPRSSGFGWASISYLGDQSPSFALLWFVLQLTGSGAAVGLVILCFDLPGVVTGAILGRLLDRYPLARAALIAAIPTLYALGSLRLSGTSSCWRCSF